MSKKQLPVPLDEASKIIRIDGGKPWTDSLTVAEKFGKRHDNVLRDLVRSYKIEYSVKPDDAAWLDVIVKEVGETRLDAVTVQWAADVVHGYKIHKQLKPATITLFG